MKIYAKEKEEKGMTFIVKTVTRLTLGFILLYGIYIALSGHKSPGGGFVGGVIVALSFVHIMLAFGKETALRRLNSNMLRFFIGSAALIFLYIVMVKISGGCVSINLFFNKSISCDIFNNEITIPLCQLVIVSSGIFTTFVALVLLSKPDKDAE